MLVCEKICKLSVATFVLAVFWRRKRKKRAKTVRIHIILAGDCGKQSAEKNEYTPRCTASESVCGACVCVFVRRSSQLSRPSAPLLRLPLFCFVLFLTRLVSIFTLLCCWLLIEFRSSLRLWLLLFLLFLWAVVWLILKLPIKATRCADGDVGRGGGSDSGFCH